MSMDAMVSSASNASVKPTVDSTAKSVLAEFCRVMGIVPLSEEEAANLPPWPEKDATAFERHINEAFERIEDVQHPL